MALAMSSLSVFALLLVTQCFGAPFKFSGGGNAGVHSNLELKAGGSGTITRDGLAFMGDGEGGIGAGWTGGAHGRAYAGVNDNMVAGQASGNINAGAELKPKIHTAIGIDSEGKIPLAFSPSIGLEGKGDIGGQWDVATGQDASHIVAAIKHQTV